MSQEPLPIYQLKVTLEGIEPPIWRRFQVYQHITFYELHLTLQAVMGWLNYHLHLFQIGDSTVTDQDTLDEWGEKGVDNLETQLIEMVDQPGTTLTYEYDFGDQWTHHLVLEARLPLAADALYPRCLDGARACPLEDTGGVWGYSDLLHALTDPSILEEGEDDEDAEYLEWVARNFDPEIFSADQINGRLQGGYFWHNDPVVPPLATGPYFTPQAARLWRALPKATQTALLENAWCAEYACMTRLIHYQGRIHQGALVLEGYCVTCGGLAGKSEGSG